MLIQNKQLAVPPEAEIRRAPFHQDAAQQHAPGRPHGHAVTTAAVDIAIEVAFDAVGDADGGPWRRDGGW